MSLPARLQDQALTGRGRWRRLRTRAVMAIAVCLIAAAGLGAQAPAPSAATLVVEWPSGRAAVESRREVLDTPVLPGSVAKVFALAAAVDAGLVDAGTTHMCRRVATADGRRFVCSHPDLKRPLSVAEALAYSCNDFFVHLAARLPRATLNETRRKAGLGPIPDGTPWATAVLGLAGPATAPRALFAAVARIVGVGPAPAAIGTAARTLLREGMRGAAEYGSASAFHAGGLEALAKTGTAPMPGGRALGLVVAFAPPTAPTRGALVVAPGGAGLDAAAIAAELLREPASSSGGAQSRSAVAARSASSPPAPGSLPAAPSSPTMPDAPTPPAGAGAAAPARVAVVPAVTDDQLRQASGPRRIRIGRTQAAGPVRIETLALEEYVARVISGEGQPRAGQAAHEALAIVIRTFATANRNRHRAEGYDLCDTTHCQVMRPSIPVARAAAFATAGRILLDGGKPAFVYYSALCGGIPALASEVWPNAVDYQPAAAVDDACQGEPAWSSDLRADQLERALRSAGLRGSRLRGLRVLGRTASQRADRLQVEGFTPPEVSAHELRMAVGRTAGWQFIRSTAFDVTRTAAGYRFRGVGYGHGVGLCVIGAGHRAARGETAAQILHAYFGTLAVGSVDGAAQTSRSTPSPAGPAPAPPLSAPQAPATDLRLALPASEERDRALVIGVIHRARAAIAKLADLPEPQGLTITVHPTVESFGRATGQPWWIAASTVGREIDLLPISVLRQRGILDSTLRHEVAHVIVGPSLASKPVWVREGAAIYFADPTAPVIAGGRLTCPSDAELLRPVSAGALREAYSRADRCYRRQLAEGRRWSDVR